LGIAFGEIGADQTKNAADNSIGNSTENASVKTGNISINVIGNLTISAAGNATVSMIFNNLTRIQCD
jgi:thiamine monophosphate synthase